jgi:hypothetical protein
MSFRLVKLSVVAALASGLVSCAARPAPRVAAAQSASSGVHWGAVTTLENCPASTAADRALTSGISAIRRRGRRTHSSIRAGRTRAWTH